MESILLFYIFPLFGICLLVFCVFAFFFPYGESIKDKIQKIKGFGIELEISVLTLFIIIGCLFLFSGLYIHNKNHRLETDLEALKEKLKYAEIREKQAEQRLSDAKKIPLNVYLVLEGSNNLHINDIECKYRVLDKTYDFKAEVISGIGPNSICIKMSDLEKKDTIALIQVINKVSGKIWINSEFITPFALQTWHLQLQN